MTIIDSLQAISLYPITRSALLSIAIECNLDGQDTMTTELYNHKDYKRAKAKVYKLLSEAPDVTEAGATYGFTDTERKAFERKANELLNQVGDMADCNADYGYFGEDF